MYRRKLTLVKIGRKLKEIRLNNNLSLNNVIKKLEEFDYFVSKKTIYKWENDTSIPDLKTIRLLSYIYNVNLSELYENTRYYKALNDHEFKFINTLRENDEFKKIVRILMKIK